MATDRFVRLAQRVAEAHEMASLPLVVIPHPVGGLPPEPVRNKADFEFFVDLTTDQQEFVCDSKSLLANSVVIP